MQNNEPAIEFPAIIAGVKVNKTGGGEGVLILNVSQVYLERMLSLGLFMGYLFEKVAFYAPSKVDEA